MGTELFSLWIKYVAAIKDLIKRFTPTQSRIVRPIVTSISCQMFTSCLQVKLMIFFNHYFSYKLNKSSWDKVRYYISMCYFRADRRRTRTNMESILSGCTDTVSSIVPFILSSTYWSSAILSATYIGTSFKYCVKYTTNYFLFT